MSSKHTPGPWIAYEIAPDDPDWGACEIWPAENDREDEEGTVKPVATMVMGVENARLIAAAPELLEALVNMVQWHGKREWPTASFEVEGLLPIDLQNDDVQKAMRAIAKATGGAQ
ncbi:TPA: hypothetical protein UM349_000329 [Stenotrophomonas maltophilia]|uniref:hypothetical protein n=1 Tax=Stenotrophomonas maltophilia TaxID=40324 RepID=UPI002556620D|nr:hypothetical protein [Stenotrophomonas maltophilia]HEL4115128.1 hypothetical protein [Stenotrophomonas maltophilia]